MCFAQRTQRFGLNLKREARTENDAYERPVEEDNWVRAIEWAESLGVNVTSTSLGYLTYDSP
ncbi:MAG: hypothetical protein ABIK27_02820 [Bacteroidota bacterium]